MAGTTEGVVFVDMRFECFYFISDRKELYLYGVPYTDSRSKNRIWYFIVLMVYWPIKYSCNGQTIFYLLCKQFLHQNLFIFYTTVHYVEIKKKYVMVRTTEGAVFVDIRLQCFLYYKWQKRALPTRSFTYRSDQIHIQSV